MRIPQSPILPETYQIIKKIRKKNCRCYCGELVIEPIPMEDNLALRIINTNDDVEYTTILFPKKKKWKTFNGEKWGTGSVTGLFSKWCNVNYINGELIKKYLGTEDVREWQDEIMETAREIKREKKEQKTKELMNQAIEIPYAFKKWVEETVFRKYKYIQYKVSQKKETEAYCTHCGSSFPIATKGLKTGKNYVCPHCHKRAELRAEGRCRGLVKDHWVQLFQSINGGQGAMFRYIHVEKKFTKFGEVKTWYDETLRIALRNGKEECYEWRCDVGEYYCYSQEDWRKNKQVTTLHNYNWPVSAILWKGNLKRELKKTKYRYAPVEDWMQDGVNKFRPADNRRSTFILEDVLAALEKYPFIESLYKIGMTNLANAIRERGCKVDKGNEIHKILGITKEQFREDRKVNVEDWEVAAQRDYLQSGIVLTEKEAKIVGEHKNEFNTIVEMVQRFGKTKVLKHIERMEKNKIRMFIWTDYLALGKHLGYNLQDEFVAMPRDVDTAHDQAIRVRDEEKEKLELKKAKERYKGVERTAKKWDKVFAYQDEDFSIRMARTNLELVKEGQTLHHCVGCGGYAEKMEKEQSFILFLRKKDAVNTPYVTVEITKDFKILQWYQKYDKKPDKDVIQPWLNNYQEVKKNGKKHLTKSA